MKKTKDMAEVVRLNSAVADEGKKIEAAYREIGRLYYERFADASDYKRKVTGQAQEGPPGRLG